MAMGLTRTQGSKLDAFSPTFPILFLQCLQCFHIHWGGDGKRIVSIGLGLMDVLWI